MFILHEKYEQFVLTSTSTILRFQFECCGAEGFTDWANINNTESDGYIPISCCTPSNGVVFGIICYDGNLPDDLKENYPQIEASPPYEKGCVESFGDFVKSHAVTLGGAGIAIAMIQVSNSLD